MKEKLIGRQAEIRELTRCLNSNRSELVILFGRRRIGKTFLVNSFFQGKYAFSYTGSHKAGKDRQLERFSLALQEYGRLPKKPLLDNWGHAFDLLKQILVKSKRVKGHKKIIFLDEMPWIDRSRSEFVAALEDFWNGWASLSGNIMLVATGSATSWMVNHLLKNQGGLYNRVTSKIHLRPFSLYECEEYLRSHRCQWDHYAITQYYMYLGGVPYYLSLLDYSRTLEENIYQFFFSPNALLENEFNDLYSVLFAHADKYVSIVKLLAEHREGMSRNEILTKMSNGGGLSKMLDNLIRCDFITRYQQFSNQKRGSIYRLTDFFSIFYLRFVEHVGVKNNPLYWNLMLSKQEVKVWQGLTFELVCLTHIEQIKHRLGISGMLTEESAWRSQGEHLVAPGKTKKAQIDLVIERSDRIIHLCEAKFSEGLFTINKDYEMSLREKMTIFRDETKTHKSLLTTMITTYGVKTNIHSGLVASQVTMEDLFKA